MAMRPVLLFSILLLMAFAPGGSTFPAISGETPSGKQVTLPAPGASGFTIIGLAYGKGASPALEQWFEPAYLRFIAKHGLMAGAYEAQVYFVPMFTGLDKVAYEPTLKKVRNSAEPDLAEHIVFFKGEMDTYKEALGLKDKDIPYFFVLDAQGNIIHRCEGDFSEEKLDAMEEVMLE